MEAGQPPARLSDGDSLTEQCDNNLMRDSGRNTQVLEYGLSPVLARGAVPPAGQGSFRRRVITHRRLQLCNHRYAKTAIDRVEGLGCAQISASAN
ncbi:uncharacterized protein ACBT57_013633 isoform 2-T4 [Dama dama]